MNTSKINYIPISRPSITQKEIDYVTAAVKSGWVSSLGKYVEKLVTSSPISVRLIKRTMKAGLTMDLRSSLDMVSSHMILARSSEDHKEAIASWREKRPGNYMNK